MTADLLSHLATMTTTTCHCWRLDRSDGLVLGFTDHDLDLEFDGVTFRADSGITASALMQTSGLSVDNTEALGALREEAITEVDIAAGRFDGAEITAWLVNWADIAQRSLLFRGQIGELKREGAAFAADLRSETVKLNHAKGRIFQKPCTAVLGDASCGFDLATPGYSAEVTVLNMAGETVQIAPQPGFEPGWFSRGHLRVLSGAAIGLSAPIKRDEPQGETRGIELWSSLRAALAPGDQVRIVAGCDKRFETCRLKFLNHLNYQGFPDLPGDDWSLSLPNGERAMDGGSRR